MKLYPYALMGLEHLPTCMAYIHGKRRYLYIISSVEHVGCKANLKMQGAFLKIIENYRKAHLDSLCYHETSKSR